MSSPAPPVSLEVSWLYKNLSDLVKSSVLAHSSELRALESVFHRIQEDWFSLPPVGCEGLDGFLDVPSPALSPNSYRVLGDSSNRLMQILSASAGAHPGMPTAHLAEQLTAGVSAWRRCGRFDTPCWTILRRHPATTSTDAIPTPRTLDIMERSLAIGCTAHQHRTDGVRQQPYSHFLIGLLPSGPCALDTSSF